MLDMNWDPGHHSLQVTFGPVVRHIEAPLTAGSNS